MKSNTLQIERIKELVVNDHLRQQFRQQLELIIVVDFNYEHIVQLEHLKTLLSSGLSQYYKEYHIEQEFLTIQAGIIAEKTRQNHYVNDITCKLPDVHSLFEELIGSKHSIINYKSEYLKNRCND